MKTFFPRMCGLPGVMRHDADYGLHACALSSNAERARRVAERIDAGRIAINGAPLVPLGGFKRSGIR